MSTLIASFESGCERAFCIVYGARYKSKKSVEAADFFFGVIPASHVVLFELTDRLTWP